MLGMRNWELNLYFLFIFAFVVILIILPNLYFALFLTSISGYDAMIIVKQKRHSTISSQSTIVIFLL